MGSSINFNFGIFIKPLVDEFGWSRSAVSAGFSIFMLVGSASAILSGGLADRYGTRRVVIFGTLLVFMSMVLVSRIQNIWEYYLLIGVLGGLGRSALNTPILAFIQRSFTRNRGLATGLAGSGGGLGILLSAPLIGYLITSYGWRNSYIALGFIIVAFTLPAVAFIRPVKKSDLEENPRTSGRPKLQEAVPLPEASQGMARIVRAGGLFPQTVGAVPGQSPSGVVFLQAPLGIDFEPAHRFFRWKRVPHRLDGCREGRVGIGRRDFAHGR